MKAAFIMACIGVLLILAGNITESVMWRLYQAGKIGYTTWERRHTPWISGMYFAAGCFIVLAVMRVIVEVT